MAFEKSEFYRRGDYTDSRPLPKGGQANVYLVRQPDVGNRHVVIKEARSGVGGGVKTITLVQNLRTEIHTLASLRHPNILTIYNVLESKEGATFGEVYLVLEYIEGGSAQLQKEQLQKEKRRFTVDEVCRIGIDICKALDRVHARGIIHRDIKPGNILLDLDQHKNINRAILADFGIVMHLDSTDNRQGQQQGTPSYAAPEQIRNEPDIKVQADIYALGATLWSLLVDDNQFEYCNLKNSQRRLDLPLYRNDVNNAVASVLSQALHSDWWERYENAAAFQKALEKVQDHNQLVQHQPTRWRPRVEIGALTVSAVLGLTPLDPTNVLPIQVVLTIMFVGAIVGFLRCMIVPWRLTMPLFLLMLVAAFILTPLGAGAISIWLLQTGFWLALLLPLATLIPR